MTTHSSSPSGIARAAPAASAAASASAASSRSTAPIFVSASTSASLPSDDWTARSRTTRRARASTASPVTTSFLLPCSPQSAAKNIHELVETSTIERARARERDEKNLLTPLPIEFVRHHSSLYFYCRLL